MNGVCKGVGTEMERRGELEEGCGLQRRMELYDREKLVNSDMLRGFKKDKSFGVVIRRPRHTDLSESSFSQVTGQKSNLQ